MAWQERSIMSERHEFVTMARQEEASIAALCRRFGISRKTAYKWLARAAGGDRLLADHSRRPHTSPGRTSADMEARIVELRRQHPAWGGRKLHHWLLAHGGPPPPPSTITSILRRHGLLASTPARLPALRAGDGQRAVATGLHGPSGHDGGACPSPDPGR
jgi:transposase-like protein